jgi:hypothetical protein
VPPGQAGTWVARRFSWDGVSGRLRWAPAPIAKPIPPPRFGLALLLLGITFFCTTTLGPVLTAWSQDGLPNDIFPLITPGLVAQVWRHAALLRIGLSFSLPVLTILFVHEMGHYLTCRRYHLPSTPPYFLPLPAVLGTLGAFIRIRVPMRSKRELFDVGVAGPLAGFVALVPFLLYGVAHSQVVPEHLDAGASRLVPGQSLAMLLAVRALHGPLAAGTVLRLHPFALAAWFGMLATAINLLPLGQLDGGHILYAAAGRWQRRLALPLWVALMVAGILWSGWVLWCVVVFAMGLYHPRVIDEATPLDPKRRLLAAAALLILALCFTPHGASEQVSDDVPPSSGHGQAIARLPPAAAGAPRAPWSAPAQSGEVLGGDQKSATSVTGPSFTSSTSIWARKRPVST